MPQYCRYCANAHEIDDGILYCNEKQKTMNRKQACRTNKCNHYLFIEECAFDPQKKYTPKESRQKEYDQLQLEV